MHKMKASPYSDYLIIANPAPTANGKYLDAFSVHPFVNGEADTNVVSYQRSISEATPYDTEQKALESAMELGGAWIDAQSH